MLRETVVVIGMPVAIAWSAGRDLLRYRGTGLLTS